MNGDKLRKKINEKKEKAWKGIFNVADTLTEGASDCGKWASENSGEMLKFLLLSGLAIKTFKSGTEALKDAGLIHPERSRYKYESEEKELKIYDYSTNMFFYLKRPMTTREKLIFEERKQYEPVGQILRDMGLLRY